MNEAQRKKKEKRKFSVSKRTKMFESFPSEKIIKRESNLPAAFKKQWSRFRGVGLKTKQCLACSSLIENPTRY